MIDDLCSDRAWSHTISALLSFDDCNVWSIWKANTEFGAKMSNANTRVSLEGAKFRWTEHRTREQHLPRDEPRHDPGLDANVQRAETKKLIAAATSESWLDENIAATRLKRDGVKVTVDGETTTHKSTKQAFIDLGLFGQFGCKVIRFRKKVKRGRATFRALGKEYEFELSALSRK
ncbi:hypothetical protein [Caballeronia sp. DA-9]|uniref:hypothetical protein n=1 Tax=Caballeronia sp. DA-9 TaxID=3436237 RepID=UPI003F66333B